METEYRVLTLWQPWATLLAHGIKMNETRPKDTSFRGIYLIHAASRRSQMQSKICFKSPFFGELYNLRYVDMYKIGSGETRVNIILPYGKIIGSFEVDFCGEVVSDFPFEKFAKVSDKISITGKEYDFGDYTKGRSIWIGKNHRLLKIPISYKNRQGYYQKFKGDINDLIFM